MQGRDCLGPRRGGRSTDESSSGAETGQLRRGRRSKRLSRSSVWRYARLDTQPTPSERSATAGMLLLSCCRPPSAPSGRSPCGRKRKPAASRRGGGRSSKASRGENPRGSSSISLVQQLLLEGGSPRRYYVLSDGRRGRKCGVRSGTSSKHGVDATSGNDMTDLKLSMGHPTYLETPPPLRARTDLDLDFNKPPMPCPGMLSKHQLQPMPHHNPACPSPSPCTMITGGLCGFMECGTQVLHPPTYMNRPVMLLPEYSVVTEPCVTAMGLDFYTVNSDACPAFVLAPEKVPMCYSQPRGDWR